MTGAAVAASALAVVAGCVPTAIWSGHSADRRHALEVVREADHERVIVDGVRREAYDSVAAWSLETAGARVVYAARLGRDWIVVDPGRPRARWDGIGALVLAGAHTAYAAERGGRWQVVVDGVAGAPWPELLAGSLRLSPDGAHAAYAARDRAGVHVVVDGAASPAYDGVAQLAFAPDAHIASAAPGAQVAYVARDRAGVRVVVDGVAGPVFAEIGRVALAGATAVYPARDADGWRVIAGGRALSPAYRAVRAIAARDGHVAWIAREQPAAAGSAGSPSAAGDLVACDGTVVGRAPAIDPDRLALIAGCDLAYVATGASGARVVHGDRAASYDAVGKLVVAGGRVAYAARTGARWQIVVDGAARDAGAFAGDPVFSPDARRLAYVARAGRRWVAVVDDHAFPFDVVVEGTLAFSRDGRRWAVIGGDLAREQLFFAVDGTRRVPLASAELYSAGERATAPDGELLRAWAAAEADK